MNLLIIGHSVADIIDSGGNKKLQPGGIFYPVIALNSLRKEDDNISLITAVDNEYYYLFKDEYEKLDQRFFNEVEHIPVVQLKILKYEERHEMYKNINQKLEINIKDWNVFDGILINMITGFDITLEQLKNIRRSYNGLIYFDVHTLSRGLGVEMHRYFRPIPDFKEWASNLDFIQVNKNELSTISEKETEEEIVNEVLGYGIKYLILTLEDKGAKIFYREGEKTNYLYEPAVKVNVKNQVGCGDVFGASFFYNYITFRDKNIEKVLRVANNAAGTAASYDDIEKFKNLKNDVSLRFYKE